MKLDAKHAVERVKDVMENTVSGQPVSVTGTHAEEHTILVELDGFPKVFKGTTDEIAKLGWRWSGQTGDPDETVNLYFRKIGDGEGA